MKMSSLPESLQGAAAARACWRPSSQRLLGDGARLSDAAPIFALNSAGGTITDGTVSTADPRVKLFITVNGQFTATYQSPTSRGSGNAVIQMMTVDRQDRPTSVVAIGNITLQ